MFIRGCLSAEMMMFLYICSQESRICRDNTSTDGLFVESLISFLIPFLKRPKTFKRLCLPSNVFDYPS